MTGFKARSATAPLPSAARDASPYVRRVTAAVMRVAACEMRESVSSNASAVREPQYVVSCGLAGGPHPPIFYKRMRKRMGTLLGTPPDFSEVRMGTFFGEDALAPRAAPVRHGRAPAHAAKGDMNAR